MHSQQEVQAGLLSSRNGHRIVTGHGHGCRIDLSPRLFPRHMLGFPNVLIIPQPEKPIMHLFSAEIVANWQFKLTFL